MPLFHRKAQPSTDAKPAAPPPPPPAAAGRPNSYAPGPSHTYSQSQQYNPNPNTSNGHGNGNSYAYGQAPPPNPAKEAYLRPIFARVDKDRNGSIDVHELKLALINANYDQFDLDTVKMLMNMFDTDRSGTIAFNEFIGLYKYVEDWQLVFRHWDTDRSGSIEENELAGALHGFGYNLSPHLIRAVMNKYSNAPQGYGAPPPSISFDRFVRACVAVRELTESFRSVDRDNDGWIQVNYDQYMQMILRAP